MDKADYRFLAVIGRERSRQNAGHVPPQPLRPTIEVSATTAPSSTKAVCPAKAAATADITAAVVAATIVAMVVVEQGPALPEEDETSA